MPRPKNDWTAGMEAFLNHPTASYRKNPQVFKEIQKTSGMSISEMFKQVGRQTNKQKIKQPTEKELSQERLDKLESKSTK
jgi:hypothetical protein